MKYLIAAASCNVLANLCLKQAALSSNAKTPIWGWMPAYVVNPFFVGGLMFFLGSVVAFTKVLQTMQINIAYPMMSSAAFAAVAIISIPLFGEKFSLIQTIGLILIVTGIALLNHTPS